MMYKDIYLKLQNGDICIDCIRVPSPCVMVTFKVTVGGKVQEGQLPHLRVMQRQGVLLNAAVTSFPLPLTCGWG